MAKKNEKTVKITLKRGLVGVPEKHVKIVKALGLNKKDATVEHAASATIMGMARKIEHLVEVVEQ